MILYVVLKEGENMLVSDLASIGLKPINEADVNREISQVYINDLLSYVMANCQEDTLWITILKHPNIIAVAQLHDFAGIIFVHNNYPPQETIDKANLFDIPLFVSDKDAFTLAKELIQLGM